MKISTKLKGSAMLIIGITFIFVGAVLYVSVKAGQAGERNQIAQKLLETSVTGVALRAEYSLTGEDRPKVQWYALQATFNNILDLEAPLFTEPANQTLYAAIRDNQERKKVTFDAVVSAIERGDNPELVARLNNQLAVTVQDGVSISTRLAELSREEHSAFHQMLKTIIGVVGLFVIFFALISYFVSRRISSSLTTLQQEFARIASLDFSSTTTTTTTRKDELGMLSRAFNTMVGKLKESYGTLEQKVRDRTQDLEEAKAQDEAILYSIGDAVMACDKDGLVMLFNGVAEKLTGFSAKEVVGHHYNQALKFVGESDGKTSDDFITEVIKTGQGTKMANHTLLITKDGQKIAVADSAAPIKNEQGEIIGCVLVFRDMTREREIDKAKTEFVSLASHQLRTPPTSINWFLEMLLSGDAGSLNEKQKEYTKEAYQNSKRMVTLVNTLLNISRTELGTFPINPEPTNMIAFTKDVLEEFELQIKEKKFEVKEQYAPNLSLIPLDPKLLRIVVQNIISNAVKYTPEKGSISVKVASQQEGETVGDRKLKTDSLVISVTDTGYGIPRNQSDKIFTKLFRADNVKDKDTDGTGLGLYLAKLIVDHVQGNLWFQSPALSRVEGDENPGTTFYLAIPSKGMERKEGAKELVESTDS